MVLQFALELYDISFDKVNRPLTLSGHHNGKNTHLDETERKKLKTLLNKYKELFDGSLGHWKGQNYDVELREEGKPYHARPYPIPKAYEQTLKMEVERLCKVGVLKKVPLRMGGTDLYHTKERRFGTFYIRLSRIKQAN